MQSKLLKGNKSQPVVSKRKKNFTSARQDLKVAGVKCPLLLCDVHRAHHREVTSHHTSGRPWTIQIGFGNLQLKSCWNINSQKAAFRFTRLPICLLRKTDYSVSTTIYTLVQPQLNLGFRSNWKESSFLNTPKSHFTPFITRNVLA